MPYIGNEIQNQGFSPAVDYYNGDGTTVTFTLSRPVASVAQLTAVIENVIQNPSTAFSVAGNEITFTSAPPAGTNNIWVEYTSLVTTYAAISQDPSVIGDITATGGYLAEGDFGNSFIDGTIVDYVSGIARITTGPSDNMTFYHGGTSARSAMMDLYHAGGAKIYGTTALTIPVGTTAQRPGTPTTGMVRYNTTESQYEVYRGTTWQYLNTSAYTYAASFLVVAGGGGGGSGYGGGGGAGGLLSGSATLNPGVVYSATVGGGGAGGTSSNSGSNGSNSVLSGTGITTQTAVGGGGGGWANSSGGTPLGGNATSGGSGGGGGAWRNSLGTTSTTSGASGTAGQGNAGGNPSSVSSNQNGYGAGGGGASASGGSGSPQNNAGAGGNGTASSITGSSVTYAGGGGGCSYGGSVGAGGTGGGGAGGNSSTDPVAGTANRGGGGGGAANSSTGIGAAGGSGVVILSVPTASYSGITTGSPTVTTSGSNTILTFTSSGTYTA